jgi:succinate-acetate transporter protein
MTHEIESPLRRSLDAIDAARRRVFATFGLFWIATFAALWWFSHVLRTTDNLKAALSAAVVALVLAIFLAAVVVALHVTRMTRKILRAIDLAAYREAVKPILNGSA